jgi:membrane-associated phospholipid phosphatase
VLLQEFGPKVGVPAYAGAVYVAVSRLSEKQHYLSDVVFGAAVGSIAGRTVTRHGREAWSLGPVAVSGASR